MTSLTRGELPLPPFYDRENVRSWAFAPDQSALLSRAQAWRSEHAVPPAGSDRATVRLLLIDLQKDFCLPQGSLYVGGRSGNGALEDADRVVRFLYRNLRNISDVTCTMDTHHPFQIFFPSFWVDGQGAPLDAHREITAGEIRERKVEPNPDVAWWLCQGDEAWLRRQVEFYCEALEKAGKYRLYLWFSHCILGSDGHALTGVVHEARLFHAFVRGARGGVELKGGHSLTENYSVLAPEVLAGHDGRALAERNTGLIDTLLESDAVIVAGQAASHCVKSSLEDLLAETRKRQESLARKVYILRDCMSSVAVPDPGREGQFLADFTPQTEAAFQVFAEAGMHLVESTTPMSEWPELRL